MLKPQLKVKGMVSCCLSKDDEEYGPVGGCWLQEKINASLRKRLSIATDLPTTNPTLTALEL
jgi:hypothetical protein